MSFKIMRHCLFYINTTYKKGFYELFQYHDPGAWIKNQSYQAGSIFKTTAIPLYTGWNLVGYPSITPVLASDTLPPMADMISVYDAANPYLIRDVTDMTSEILSCYNGYWVHVTADTMWVIDA